MISRRAFLRLMGGMTLGGLGLAYGAIVEPFYRLRVTRYALSPSGWPASLNLKIAVVADLHACAPWMDGARVAKIVEKTNALNADVIMLLGDYVASHPFQKQIPMRDWAEPLGRLNAPLGVHAVLGNHDWWSDRLAMARGGGLPTVGLALQEAGVKIFQNDAVRLVKDGKSFWILGLGDQIAFLPLRGWRHPQRGIDDLPSALSRVTDDAPVLLMAHEPDIFPVTPSRISLTISGHTHGGQFNFFGWTPISPSRYGDRYIYGHKIENGRHIVISGGLGCSGAPLRIGCPPEIVLIELGSNAT